MNEFSFLYSLNMRARKRDFSQTQMHIAIQSASSSLATVKRPIWVLLSSRLDMASPRIDSSAYTNPEKNLWKPLN